MAIFKRNDSPYWWFAFTLNGQQYSGSTQTSDKKLAEQIYINKRSYYQKVQYGFEQPKTKLGELFHDYIELYAKHYKATWKSNVFMLARMKKFLGDVKVSEISSADIEKYRAQRISKGVAKSTINRDMAVLKHVFNKGIEWGKCIENPVRKIKFYSEKENKRTRYLSLEEKTRLLATCPLPTKRLVIFALLTGMRQGEILSLRWADVDFNTNLIKIAHSKSKRPRFVNINSELEKMLKSMPTVSEYVFGIEKNKPKFTLYRKPYEAAVKKAGLNNFRFHDLRHTFASDLVMKGVDLKTVSELLGHASMQMTERYAHLSPAHKRAAVELLPKGLFYYAGTTLDRSHKIDFHNFADLSSDLSSNGLLAQLAEQATLNPALAVFGGLRALVGC